MAEEPLDNVLRYLRRIVDPGAGSVSDGDLLERYIQHRDQAAFELLLRRHVPTVLGVCRRVLRHQQDAEDAFQATFLVLARKASSIGKRTALGCWLYKVAYRVAQRARAGIAKRQAHQKTLVEVAATPV